jgi:carbon starvation protein
MIAAIIFGGAALFLAAYVFYGRFLSRHFDLTISDETPAHSLRDDIDYAPAKPAVLLGHHFSSIAGAGPIVGPIFATLIFGWGPAVIWIILGSIFIGGVHDFGALAISLKHRAQSIAQVAREELSPLAGRLFLAFVWLALVYVLVVFLDLTAGTFAPSIPAGVGPQRSAELLARGGGVATSSLFFVLLAICFGIAVRRFKLPVWLASSIFVPLMFLGIFLGHWMPLTADLLPTIGGSAATTWRMLLIVYCFIASVTPVWILLQPRDYLSSFFLYACLGGGLLGVLFGALGSSTVATLAYPAFLGFHSDKLGYLFPALFITIACGACSGFHSLVASGTTAKQLDRTKDARLIGYGSMLIEGLLALLSVGTVAVLSHNSPEVGSAPPAIFAVGLSRFLAQLGIPASWGTGLGMLALSTFLLTTLDTGTRLCRYVVIELFSLKGRRAAAAATAGSLAIPLLLGLSTFHDPAGNVVPAWKIIWPVFGATNQLLGGLALMVISVWLRRRGKSAWPTALPMYFMLVATLLALVQLVFQHGASIIGAIAAFLLLLAVVLLAEAARVTRRSRQPTKPSPSA